MLSRTLSFAARVLLVCVAALAITASAALAAPRKPVGPAELAVNVTVAWQDETPVVPENTSEHVLLEKVPPPPDWIAHVTVPVG